MSRFQLLIFTFVIAMSLFLMVANNMKFPEIPNGVWALLGISGGSYVVSKGIQCNSEEEEKKIEASRSGTSPSSPDKTTQSSSR